MDAIPIQIHGLPLALPARTARIVRTTIAVTARVDRIIYPHPPLASLATPARITRTTRGGSSGRCESVDLSSTFPDCPQHWLRETSSGGHLLSQIPTSKTWERTQTEIILSCLVFFPTILFIVICICGRMFSAFTKKQLQAQGHCILICLATNTYSLNLAFGISRRSCTVFHSQERWNFNMK